MFEREGDYLVISRSSEPLATELTLSGHSITSRELTFASHGELVDFQLRFEEHLLETGWHFVSFTPERRSGGERRARAPEPDRRNLLPFRKHT